MPARGVRRALVLKPCCLGDVLLATPLAAALAAAWPDARIEWAVDRHSRPALEGNPDLAGLLDASGCVPGALKPSALVRLVQTLRRRRYEVAFVPDRSRVLALVPLLAGVPWRVGLDSAGRGRPHSVRVPVAPDRHEAELYLDLARAVGLTTAGSRPRFAPSADARASARRALDAGTGPTVALHPGGGARAAARRALGAGTGPIVALHPGGGVNPGMRLTEKRWPADRFAGLADRLHAERGARVVVLGGPGDAAVVDAVRSAATAPLDDLSGARPLGEVAAIIEACDLYVGNDSGIAHLATAVGTPVVAVFGPTDPRRYGPVPGAGVAVAPPGGVAVERLAAAAGSRAVEGVTVDAVWAAAREALDP